MPLLALVTDLPQRALQIMSAHHSCPANAVLRIRILSRHRSVLSHCNILCRPSHLARIGRYWLRYPIMARFFSVRSAACQDSKCNLGSTDLSFLNFPEHFLRDVVVQMFFPGAGRGKMFACGAQKYA